MKHKAIRIDNLMYKGCEPHWKCTLCGDVVPFHCYTKEEFENRCCGCHKINCADCTRTPKERGADKPKITCLNCKHLMFSDMYGECNKQLRIVNPSDTCEYAEPKERGREK